MPPGIRRVSFLMWINADRFRLVPNLCREHALERTLTMRYAGWKILLVVAALALSPAGATAADTVTVYSDPA
jgi:hypothetical protein